jgi:hypothetical protein
MLGIGFDGRMFLSEQEWRTYLRRMPVRYIKKEHSSVCSMCGELGTAGNPLQHSHIIGFSMGIISLGLTPEWLDGDHNILSAHRKKCNKSVELILADAMERLRRRGLCSIPSYLPSSVLDMWEDCCQEFNCPC